MTRNGLPRSWADAQERLAAALGGPSCMPDVDAWLREAVLVMWGAESLVELERSKRSLAFQKFSGVVLAVEDLDGDVAFRPDHRDVIRRVFARYFNGVSLDGPVWRVSPFEDERPDRSEVLGESEFNDDDLEV